MTAEEQQAFEDKIYAYVGRKVCDRTPAKDMVNDTMIRHWTEVIGDTNPAYTNPEWAADSRRGKTIAPPAMMYVWNQEGYAVASTGRPSDAQSDLVQLFNDNGYTGVLGTNVKQEYFAEASPGDENVLHLSHLNSVNARRSTDRRTDPPRNVARARRPRASRAGSSWH